MPRRDEFDDEGFFDSLMKRQAGAPMPPSMARLLLMVAGFAVLATIIAVAWITWPSDKGRVDEENLPVLEASDDAYKIKPEDPGGMAVPNKDSTIFEALNSGADKKTVENLLDEPEEPMKKEEVFGEEKIAVAETVQPAVAETKSDKPEVKADVKKEDVKAEVKEEIKKTEPLQPKTETQSTTKPASGSSYIQLAAVKSDAEAKQKWAKLQSQFNVLQAMSLRVQKADLGAKGTFYRVQAGPISVEAAQSACGKIKTAGGDCLVIK